MDKHDSLHTESVSSAAEPLWQLRQVSLPGDTAPRLDNISVEIGRGVTAVIGYSGAGKTSLLHLLSTLEIPGSGSIEVAEIVRSGAAPFCLPTFWVPQNAGLWSHLRAIEHIEAVQSAGITQKSATPRESADNWLAKFDLSERRRAYPAHLSRGEQSRLAVARALAANPAVLLMDEPLAHVDPIRTPQYWSVIREHLTTTGASLVFSTHEPSVAIQESHHVICLKSGKVTATGATAEIYAHPPTQEVGQFLGPVNWFLQDQVSVWLPADSLFPSTADGADGVGGAEGALGLRPENIHLRGCPNGVFEILSFRFAGSYAETQLQHRDSAQVRTIIHRPAGGAHFVGQRVELEVIS